MMVLPFFASAQQGCSMPLPGNWTWYGPTGHWAGYTFQISKNYKPNYDYNREFANGDADRKYKGFLKYGPGGLPDNTLNFDLDFGGGQPEDASYFKTDSVRKSGDGLGCEVERQYFGVVLRAVYVIPPGQGGVYRFTIGSDDGSSLRVKKNGNPVLDIVHDNWSEGKSYVYGENIINNYREYNPGDRLEFFLSFYEIEGFNRLSFHFERYFGPGEIEGSQELCRIAPDPAPFKSKAAAVFEEGGSANISYQWQVSRDPDSDGWEDVAGETGLEYDIPAYSEADKSSAEGLWHYRRLAILTNVDTAFEFPSEPLFVNLGFVPNMDREEFGDNFWIGHVYKGLQNFSDADSLYNTYLGRFLEESEFRQEFRHENQQGNFLDYKFPLDVGGCDLVTTDFSIRYKMKLDVLPGVYTFRVNGDDRFRLFIDGQLRINDWQNASERPARAKEYEYVVEKAGKLELILDYYEGTDKNTIDFSYPSVILPLEWGQVKAEACGLENCLTWETIQEKNTSHFELERSYNGFDWEMFDSRVQAQGMSTQKITYSYADGKFLNNQVYYRIKQVDLDGSFAYSDVTRVNNPSFARPFHPFPNPTFEKIRFFSQGRILRLTLISNNDYLAKELRFEKLHADMYEADLSGLKSGNYIITVHQEHGGMEVFKIIKK